MLLVPVAYRSPILIAAVFARPTSLCAPQRVERSDPITRTEATRGPRRLKGLVIGTQGEGDRPAAGSRRTLEHYELRNELRYEKDIRNALRAS